MIVDKACWERGCACHDTRVDGEGVEVVKKEWVGLTRDEVLDIEEAEIAKHPLAFYRAIEAKLKEKNT
jgi:hypothetical protein